MLRPRVVVSRPAPARRAAPATPRGNVYAYDGANRLTGAARFAKQLVYVPNSQSDTVDVIDPHTFRIVEHFPWAGSPSTSCRRGTSAISTSRTTPVTA